MKNEQTMEAVIRSRDREFWRMAQSRDLRLTQVSVPFCSSLGSSLLGVPASSHRISEGTKIDADIGNSRADEFAIILRISLL